MNCPACGSELYEIADKRDPDDKITTRRRWCGSAACGVRWNTTETIDKGQHFVVVPRTTDVKRRVPPSVVARNAQRTVQNEHNGQGPPTQQTGQTKHNGLGFSTQQTVLGGEGVGLGSGVTSGSHSDSRSVPDRIPSLLPDQGVDRAREGGIDYPVAFELLWESTGRRGGKYPAFRMWKKVGRPTWDAIGARWRAYLLSERPQAGFIKDLSSWLNGRGHEQDWEPAPARPRNGHAPRGTVQALEDEHRRMFEEGREWAKGGT